MDEDFSTNTGIYDTEDGMEAPQMILAAVGLVMYLVGLTRG